MFFCAKKYITIRSSEMYPFLQRIPEDLFNLPPHTLAQSLVGPLVELLTQKSMQPRNAPQGTTFKTFCLLWFLAGSGAFHVQPNARFSVVRDDSGILGSSRRGTLTTRKAT